MMKKPFGEGGGGGFCPPLDWIGLIFKQHLAWPIDKINNQY